MVSGQPAKKSPDTIEEQKNPKSQTWILSIIFSPYA